MSNGDINQTRKKLYSSTAAERKISEILNAAAGSITKTIKAGFGQTVITVSVRHGAICEAKIEAKETTTVTI